MEIINVPIADIVAYENNPRKNDKAVDVVAKSIKEFGFLVPIILDDKNIIVAGHTRVKAAIKLGITTVPVIYTEGLDEKQIKAFRLMDNKSHEYAYWNWKSLKEELEALQNMDIDMGLTGFTEAEIASLLGVDEDDFEGKPPKYDIKIGDLWELGDHRLICGDATDSQVLKKLLNGKKIKLCITSPPYNMKGVQYKDFKDDLSSQEYIDFNLKTIKNIEPYLEGYLFWNLSYNKNSRWEFIEIFHRIVKETELRFLENIIWDKGHGMPINSPDMLTRSYEMILVVGEEETVQKELTSTFIGTNSDKVYLNKKGFKALTNYWRISTNKTQTEEHKAAFPVELPLKAIQLMTDKDEVILDCFGGTGTTIIAAEKAGRKAHLIELSPTYCSYIIERWEKITGKKATKTTKNG